MLILLFHVSQITTTLIPPGELCKINSMNMKVSQHHINTAKLHSFFSTHLGVTKTIPKNTCLIFIESMFLNVNVIKNKQHRKSLRCTMPLTVRLLAREQGTTVILNLCSNSIERWAHSETVC